MELRPTQMQQTTINSEYGSLMKNPDRDADDCKTKQGLLMLPSTCTLNRVETKNMRIYK